MEKFLEYNPAANIHLIAPTPLLMVVASNDTLTPVDLALTAYERALEPKSLDFAIALAEALPCEPFRQSGKAGDIPEAADSVSWRRQLEEER